MLSKPLLAIILAACSVSSTPATAEPTEQPDEFQPPGPHVKFATVRVVMALAFGLGPRSGGHLVSPVGWLIAGP